MPHTTIAKLFALCWNLGRDASPGFEGQSSQPPPRYIPSCICISRILMCLQRAQKNAVLSSY